MICSQDQDQDTLTHVNSTTSDDLDD